MCPKITQRGIGKLGNNRSLRFQECQSYYHKFRSAPVSPIPCSFQGTCVPTAAKPIQLNTPRLFSLDAPLINIRAARGCQVGRFPLRTMVSVQRNLSNHSESCLSDAYPTPAVQCQRAQDERGQLGREPSPFSSPPPEEGTRGRARHESRVGRWASGRDRNGC